MENLEKSEKFGHLFQELEKLQNSEKLCEALGKVLEIFTQRRLSFLTRNIKKLFLLLIWKFSMLFYLILL